MAPLWEKPPQPRGPFRPICRENYSGPRKQHAGLPSLGTELCSTSVWEGLEPYEEWKMCLLHCPFLIQSEFFFTCPQTASPPCEVGHRLTILGSSPALRTCQARRKRPNQ